MCACSCHGRRGVAVTTTAPYDQCTVCAKKHIDKAYELFREFTYTDDNRRTIHGQLRCAADHLMYDHRDLALEVRDLAVMIQEARDAEITTEWNDVLIGVDAAFYEDHPEILERLEKLRKKSTL